MSRRECSNLGFAMGITKDIPKQLTRFELMANRPGLNSEHWKDSRELKQFAKDFCDSYYVPEALLQVWRITTIWDEHRKPTTLVPDELLDLLVDTESEPALSPEYI
jgi:hypothetical protein